MLRSLFAFVFAIILSFSSKVYAKPEAYEIDPSHTSILFFINHLGLSRMVGEFNEYKATILLDEKKPESSSVEITIDPESIETGHDGLNDKLQGKDWFDSDKYETIVFKSTSIKRISDKKAKITGDLTMHGVTKPITLDATFNKKAEFYGQTRVGFSLKGKLKRSDFGISNGIPDVADELEILVETEVTRGEMKMPPEAKH